MREVAEDVLVGDVYHGANVGCVLTHEGAVFVDAPIVPSEARSWRRALEDATGAEFVYAFATDNHPNHVVGNAHLGAPPIANERAYRGMARFTPTMRERVLDLFRDWAPEIAEELADFEVVPPEVTFDEDLTLYKGDRTLRMIRLGGHTPATSVLFVEEERVLFTGDIVVEGIAPFIGQGSLGEWMLALARIRQLEPLVVVPGHGVVGDLGLVESMEGFLSRLREGVVSLINEGRSRAETATRMLYLLEEFEVEGRWQRRVERSFRTSVTRVYEEMRAEMQEGAGQ